MNRQRLNRPATNHGGCRLLPVFLVLLAVAIAACTPSGTAIETPTEPPEPTVEPTATHTPIPTAVPTHTPLPTATPTPGPLTSAEIFRQVSPSVAYIETAVGSGSGILTEDGYLLTNAHVVWPFKSVRVVFADGSEYTEAPVLNMDMLNDLAIVGPLDTEVEPLALVDGEDLEVASTVYLIGYPGEVEKYPQPTIAAGILSRVREWEPAETTYFQVDTKTTGGQSGGALVTDRGEVIGIANFRFTDAGFGLAASAADVAPRMADLIAGKDTAGLGDRHVPLKGGQKQHNLVNLDNEWHVQTYILNAAKGSDVEISADGGDNDIAFFITDAAGVPLESVDEYYDGVESYAFTTEVEAPYFVNFYQYAPDFHYFSIESSHKLAQYPDFDDHRGIVPGQSHTGCLDYPGDFDHFLLSLDEGERVNIMVDSIMVDPLLSVGVPGAYGEQLLEDDNAGAGIFGTNAELTIIAADPGTYLLTIHDAQSFNVGGYTLHVREPYEGGPTPVAIQPPPAPFHTDYGPMWPYESEQAGVVMFVPADWTDQPGANFGEMAAMCEMVQLCLAGDGLLMVSEEDVGSLGDWTLESYASFYIDLVESFGYSARENRPFTTQSGLEGRVLFLDFGDMFQVIRFLFIQDNLGFNYAYLIEAGDEEALWPLIEFTFSTIEAGR